MNAKERNNVFATIIDIASIGFAHHKMIFDENANPIDYLILDINETFVSQSGKKKTELLGKTIKQVFPNINDDPFNWIEFYGNIVKNQEKKVIEQYSTHLKKWFRIETIPNDKDEFSVLTYVIDSEFGFKEASIEFFEINPDLLCIANTEGQLLKVNKSWEEVLGYSTSFLEKSKFLDFIHPDDIESTLKAINELDEGKTVFQFVNRYKTKEGEYKYLEWHSTPKENLIFATARDITDTVRREAASKTDHEFISYLIEIATSYINIPLEEIELSIQNSLNRIGSFTKSDRAFIFKYDWDKNICLNSNEWTADKISKSIALLQSIDNNLLDNLSTYHQQGKPYHVKNMNELPENSTFRKHLEEQDIKCVATIPIMIKNTCLGFVGIERVINSEFFNDQEIQLLYLYANVIANLYQREYVEKNLTQERDKLRHVIEGTEIGTWEWDVRTDLLHINQQWAHLIGYELHELEPVTFPTWKNLVHPDDLVVALKDINLHLQGRIPQYNVQFRMKHKAGHWIWLNSRGKITEFNEQGKGIRMYGIHIDLTASKEKELVIQESETKYRILADHTFHWEFWLGPDGKPIYHSKSCENTTGFQASKFLKDKNFLFSRIHPDDLESYKLHYEHAINYPENNQHKHDAKDPYIIRFKHKNGSYRILQHICKPVFNESGTFLGIRGTNIDITVQENLREEVALSEVKYRTLFEDNPLPLYVYSYPDLKILNANKAAINLFGYSRSELLNMSILDLRDKEEGDRLVNRLKKDNGDFTYLGVWKYLTKDGQTILGDKHSRKINYEGVSARLTMIQNVTEQIKLQKEIEENKNFLTSIIENSGTLIYTKDLEGRYQLVNQKWEDITSIQRERAIGKNDWELFDKDSAAEFVKNDQDVISSGFVKEIEEILYSNDGNRYFITYKFPIRNTENKITGICGISTEITDRKYSEEAIRKLSRVVEQSPSSIVITDTLGQIEYVNKKFTELTGYSFKEALHQNPRMLQSGDKTRQDYEHLWASISNGLEWKGEFRNKKKDGTIYWENALISPIKDENGIITHYVAIKDDITEKKAKENLLKESEETFRKLYEDTKDPILLMNESIFVSCNNAAVQMLEARTKESILGISPNEISPELQPDGSNSKEMVTKYINEAYIEGYKRFEWVCKTFKENLIYLEVTIMPIVLKGEQLLHVTWRNISARKEAELRIIRSETRYRLLAENSSDVIWILNLSQNRFTYISPSIRHLRGLTVEEALQERMEDSMTPESLQKIQERVADNIIKFIEEKGQNDFHEINEIQQPHKNGKLVWVEVSTRFSFNEDGEVEVVGVSRNIEERKKVEQERIAYANSIKESKERLEELAENSRTVVWEIDMAGVYQYVSNVASLVYGYQPDELVGKKTIFDLHPEKGREEFIQKILSYKDSPESAIDLENPIETKDGRIVWVNSNAISVTDENGDIVGYRGTDVDITDRKIAELSLEEKNNQLTIIIENIPGAVFSAKNDALFTILFMSPFIKEITGYEPNEINKDQLISFIDLIHHDDINKRTTAMEEAFSEGRKYTATYRMLHKSGTFHWVYEIGEFKFEKGLGLHNIKIDGIIFDITDKIAAEEEKISAVLAATDEERSRIAHELHEGLQQTLVAAKMNLELLQKEIDLLSPGTQSNFDRGLELLRDGIKETRSISHSLVPKQVKEFGLAAAIENLTVNIGKKIDCSYYYQSDLEMLNDATALNLYRIVQEAVTNVLKHAKASKLFINLTKENNFLILTIEDNGLGFNPVALTKSGKGIGLLAMKNRASSIGATMDISSEIGRGTLISIEVPITTKDKA